MDIGFENQIERNQKKGQDNRKKRRGKTAYLNNDWAMSISETGSGNERKANIQFSGPWNVAQLQPFRNQKVKSINRPPGIAGNRRESPGIAENRCGGAAASVGHPSAASIPIEPSLNWCADPVESDGEIHQLLSVKRIRNPQESGRNRQLKCKFQCQVIGWDNLIVFLHFCIFAFRFWLWWLRQWCQIRTGEYLNQTIDLITRSIIINARFMILLHRMSNSHLPLQIINSDAIQLKD